MLGSAGDIVLIRPREMAVEFSLLVVLLMCWGVHWTRGQGSKIMYASRDVCTCGGRGGGNFVFAFYSGRGESRKS